jgi:hypothetical protein
MIVTVFVLIAISLLAAQAAKEGYRQEMIIKCAGVTAFTWVAIWHLRLWLSIMVAAFDFFS